MDTYRGYKIKQKRGLSHWDALLEEWLLANERYCRITGGGDAPYMFSERANIGVLAAAAWRCGRVALEEFQLEKGVKYRPKWYGRADLWMASEDEEELIEAKFKWISMKAQRGISEIVAPIMDKAVKDVKVSNGSMGVKSFGVGFFPLYVSSKHEEDIDVLIEATLGLFCASDYHAMAWCFPKEMRSADPESRDITPGVVMLVKNASI